MVLEIPAVGKDAVWSYSKYFFLGKENGKDMCKSKQTLTTYTIRIMFNMGGLKKMWEPKDLCNNIYAGMYMVRVNPF